VQLRRAPAADVVRVVDSLLQKRVQNALIGTGGGDTGIQDGFSLVSDDRTNTVVIYAHPKAIESIEQIVKQVDELGTREKFVIYPLKYVDADTIAPTVQDLLSRRIAAGAAAPSGGGAAAGPPAPGGGGGPGGGGAGAAAASAGGGGTGAGRSVTVRGDARTRQLLVSAPDEEQAIAEEIIKALDRPASEERAVAIEYVTFTQARAADVAATLRDVYSRTASAAPVAGGGPAGGGPGGAGAGGGSSAAAASATGFTVDERTNSIIVTAPRDLMGEILSLARKLEETAGDVRTVRDFTLQRANPDQVKAIILGLLQSGAGGATTGGGAVTPTGPLNPGGRPGAIPAATGPTPPAAGGSGSGSSLTTIELRPAGPGRGAVRVAVDATKVNIQTDPRVGSLIVSAPALVMPLIENLIRRLDETPPVENLLVRVVPLENADASATASTLQAVFNLQNAQPAPSTGGTGGTGGPGGATPFSPQPPAQQASQNQQNQQGQLPRENRLQVEGTGAIGAASPTGETGAVASLYNKTIRVSPDRRTNSLLLVGDRQLVQAAEDLARSLDSDSSLERDIFLYPLKNANSDAVAQQVGDLLSAQARSAGGGASGGGAGGTGTQNRTSAGTSNASRNSRGGTTAGRSGGGGGAGGGGLDLSASQGSFGTGGNVQGQGVTVSSGGGAIDASKPGSSFARALEADVTVISVPDNNAVLVSSPRRYSEKVREIIRELDRQPPQVLITGLVAQVNVNDDDVFGAQINVRGGDNTTLFGGNNQFFTQNAPEGVFAGTLFANVASGTGGLTVSGSGSNINYLVRALQSQGRLRVIQEPKILTLNNVAANIVVGQQVPIISNSTINTVAGGTTNTITYQQLGIILEVIPHINPDGFIKMELHQENSSIDTTRTVPISTNPNGGATTAPVFQTQTAETILNVKDGETIVIGGLISDSVQESVQKVPFLGDIPIVGLAFSGRTQSVQKTELIIVLTTKVIRSVEDARQATLEQKRRMFLMDDKALNFAEYGNRKRLDRRFDAGAGGMGPVRPEPANPAPPLLVPAPVPPVPAPAPSPAPTPIPSRAEPTSGRGPGGPGGPTANPKDRGPAPPPGVGGDPYSTPIRQP
jgi:type II secretion system protein D